MLKVTTQLKAWLTDNDCLSADDDGSDENCQKAAAMALVSGKLTAKQLEELTADPDAQKASALESKLDAILKGQSDTSERLAKIESGDYSGAKLKEDSVPPISKEVAKAIGLGEPESTQKVDVVSVAKMYSNTKSELRAPETLSNGAKHPIAGQRLSEGSSLGSGKRFIDSPSDLDMAAIGAVTKWMLGGGMAGEHQRAFRLTDHEKHLLEYSLHEMAWGGEISVDGDTKGINKRRLNDREIKAVLDDNTSGGLEIAPIVFDDAVITIPLLFGELFPRVNVVNITRGRRIEGATIGSITGAWGGADGTNITPFATASLIAAFDTTIYVWNGAIEIGLDFMSDTPIDFGRNVTEQYGNELLKQLDTVIATGNGTTQPQGITNASGTTTVSSANGAGGPPTVGDYEGLLFAVSKEYRAGTPSNRIVFAANETSYARARGIAVGSGDARRVFGMTHEDYMLLGHPYAINESFTNAQQVFANLARYRMYRRLGLTLRTSSEGRTNMLSNQMLVVARARFGGKLEDGAAAAKITDAQS